MTNNKIILKGEKIEDFFIHAYRFIFLTGIRRGEACALENTDIISNMVHITKSLNTRNVITDGKTQNSKRHFALTLYAKKELDNQKRMLQKYNIKSK